MFVQKNLYLRAKIGTQHDVLLREQIYLGRGELLEFLAFGAVAGGRAFQACIRRQMRQEWAMVDRAQIREFSKAVARKFRPQKIVLFGSYAYGTPTEDSDVDLLVVMPFDRRKGRKSLEIRRTIPAGFPMDLIVRTPEFIAQRLAWGDSFTQEIFARGKVLYEADHR